MQEYISVLIGEMTSFKALIINKDVMFHMQKKGQPFLPAVVLISSYQDGC